MHAELSVVLEELHVSLGVVEDRRQQLLEGAALPAGTATQQPPMPPPQQQQQPLGSAPSLEATLQQLRAATASNSLEAAASLQKQLAEALAAAGAGGPAGAAGAAHAGGHQPPYRLHPCAELHLERLQVRTALRTLPA